MAAAVIAAGLVLAGVPEDMEGLTVIGLGPGRGITESNLVAVSLLAIGSLTVMWGIWKDHEPLLAVCRSRLVPFVILVVQFGFGAVLFLLSGVSTSLALWAPGTLLLVLALFGLAAVAAIPAD
jgi:hypothetical protein